MISMKRIIPFLAVLFLIPLDKLVIGIDADVLLVSSSTNQLSEAS